MFIKCFIVLVLLLVPVTVQAEQIDIYYNDEQLELDTEPLIIDGRTMVPFRAIFEAHGAEVEWVPESQVVNGYTEHRLTVVSLAIGKKQAQVNATEQELDVAPVIHKKRTLVPLRFVSESLGSEVVWDNGTVFIDGAPSSDKALTNHEFRNHVLDKKLHIYMQTADVAGQLGSPGRVLKSEYGFDWHVYNQDYHNFVMVGVEDGSVVALYSNSPNWELDDLSVGTLERDIINEFGEPMDGIRKDGTFMHDSKSMESIGRFETDDLFYIIGYDNDKKARSIQVLDRDTKYALDGYNGVLTEEVLRGMEKISLDLVNAARVNNGIPLLDWVDTAAGSARAHSSDMAHNDFFSHVCPGGYSPVDRYKKYVTGSYDGELYDVRLGENISKGFNAMLSHEFLMNSPSHFDNIMRQMDGVGVGIYAKNEIIYLTQVFYKDL